MEGLEAHQDSVNFWFLSVVRPNHVTREWRYQDAIHFCYTSEGPVTPLPSVIPLANI